MILPWVVEDAAWYGPATVTFAVQFPGDPFDASRNDVRVRFIGDKSQREERMAYFDPVLGAWRATLFSKQGGTYRAVLVRNGKEALVEPNEGLVEIRRDTRLGILTSERAREERLTFDTGENWAGIGVDLKSEVTTAKINALADAGATWVRISPPDEPLGNEALDEFGAAMDTVERRGLAYTLALPKTSSAAWKRYVLSRFGSSPRLVQWEASADLGDPWTRATESTASTWNEAFENRPGPFIVREDDLIRIKALREALEASAWLQWKAPQLWKNDAAKGVGESDRFMLVARPGAKLTGIPLADGDYSLTSIDPATADQKMSEIRVEHSAIPVKIESETFLVLRRLLRK